MRYDEKILNSLLDSYENSLLSRGENKVAVHIAFPFTKKTIPAYFDESSTAYEEIHAQMKELENCGLIQIAWKKGKENHIVQKVLLQETTISESYHYVNRMPVDSLRTRLIRMLEELRRQCRSSEGITNTFINWILQRLQQGKTVKEYLDLVKPEEAKQLILAVNAIEENHDEVYVREFSVRCFGDTKKLERHLGVIAKIFRRFSDAYEEMEAYDILAEHGIYHTPNYVYIKGTGTLSVGTGTLSAGDGTSSVEHGSGKSTGGDDLSRESGNLFDLHGLRQGIGLSGEDLDSIVWRDLSTVKRVITIENLTTFFRWDEPDSLMIYLGGYLNTVRRRLLKKIYEALREADYLHFGDIDVGGFQIYLDLCKKTDIPFQPYLMGVSQLQTYAPFTRELTENDRKRASQLLEKDMDPQISEVLLYMLRENQKLEQECIRREK